MYSLGANMDQLSSYTAYQVVGTKSWFRYYNYLAIIGHFISFFAMTVLYTTVSESNVVIPYTETFQKWEHIEQNATCPLGSRPFDTSDGNFCIMSSTQPIDCNNENECYGIDLGWLVISFHVLSFLFQLIAALTDVVKQPICGYRYSEMIPKSTNPLRFIEYGISASVMLVAIALLNGITDINLVVSIAVLTCACQLCGLVVEYTKDIVLKWLLHFTGWLQFACAYGIIFSAFFKSIENSPEDAGPPNFVYIIVVALFLLYSSFGFVQLVELCYLSCDKRINPYSKEVSYVILSLIAKSLLGWMIFSNVLIFSNRS